MPFVGTHILAAALMVVLAGAAVTAAVTTSGRLYRAWRVLPEGDERSEALSNFAGHLVALGTALAFIVAMNARDIAPLYVNAATLAVVALSDLMILGFLARRRKAPARI